MKGQSMGPGTTCEQYLLSFVLSSPNSSPGGFRRQGISSTGIGSGSAAFQSVHCSCV